MRPKTELIEDYVVAAGIVCVVLLMFAITVRFIIWVFA